MASSSSSSSSRQQQQQQRRRVQLQELNNNKRSRNNNTRRNNYNNNKKKKFFKLFLLLILIGSLWLLFIISSSDSYSYYNNYNNIDIMKFTTTMTATDESVVVVADVVNNINTTTTLKSILQNYSEGCGPNFNKYPLYVQDNINELLGTIMLQQNPKYDLVDDTPPPLPIDISKEVCSKGEAPNVYTGNLYSTNLQPLLYVAFMFSHEIDILEIRLYEGLGIVDKYFVGESRYTHRGHKKHLFTSDLFSSADEGGRLSKFSNQVIIVDLDLCPKYMKEILKYRYMTNNRPQNIWSTQGLAQECMTDYIRNYTTTTTTTTSSSSSTTTNNNNNNNALVYTSDLDEILYRETLIGIKYCQIKPDVIQRYMPLPVYTTYNTVGKLCLNNPIVQQKIPGLLFIKNSITNQRRPTPKYINQYPKLHISSSSGGIHMTYMGGNLVMLYKSINHAEGGNLPKLGWLKYNNNNNDDDNNSTTTTTTKTNDDNNNNNYNPTVCDATEEDWFVREKLMCYDKRLVIRPWEKPKPKPNNPNNNNNEYPTELLPWILQKNVHNRKRYPCFFSNIQDCVDTYINYML